MMVRSISFTFGFFAALLVLAPKLEAKIEAATPNLKFGFVNYQQAFELENEAQKFNNEINKELEKLMQSEQKLRTEIDADYAKYQENMPKLDEKAKLAQQTAINNKVTALQQVAQQKAELEEKAKTKTADWQRKNQLLLDSIRDEEGYDVILPRELIASMSDRVKKMDVTPKLVEKFNKAYSVKPEPQKNAPKGPAPKTPTKK